MKVELLARCNYLLTSYGPDALLVIPIENALDAGLLPALDERTTHVAGCGEGPHLVVVGAFEAWHYLTKALAKETP